MKKNFLTGITLFVIVGAFIVLHNSNILIAASEIITNKKSFSSDVVVSPKPTILPTKPVASSTPTPLPATPIGYQNYGWYMHNGKSMQYVNGAWYAEAQTPSTPTPFPYENYGWYMHDGQSMQYLNGKWYSVPQQDATPTPIPEPSFDEQCRASHLSESWCNNCKEQGIKLYSACESLYRRWHNY